MKNFRISRRLPLLAAAAVLLFTTSCNRGVGCPTNLGLNDLDLSPVVTFLGYFF